MCFKITVILLYLILIGSSATAFGSQAAELSVQEGKIYLPCQFDSLKTSCLLDSGSGFSTVNNQSFDAYPSVGKVKYNGGTGREISVDRIYIQQLRAAHLILNHWPVARLPHQAGFMNIIGLDVFLHSEVLFDFEKLKIIIDPPQPKLIETVPFLYDFGLILLPVEIGDQGLLAVWDTGASTTVIDQAYVSQNPSQFIFIKEIQGTDATRTKMKMKLYKIKSLMIGGIQLKDVPVAATDLSNLRKIHPTFPVFFLGYNILIQHRWYFDFPRREWKLD